MEALVEKQKINEPDQKSGIVGLVVTLFFCVLSYQLSLTMVNPALPNIANTLHVSVDKVSQVSSLVLLTASVVSVVLARWSDFIGRRPALFILLISMGVGTLICMLAPTFTVLLIGRVLQGVAGASFQLCYVTLRENISAKQFGTVLGIITAANGGIGGIDAYAGGFLSDNFGFRSIFGVIFIFVLISLIGVIYSIPKGRSTKVTGRMDWWGAVAISITLIFMTFFIDTGSSVGWFSLVTLIYLTGIVVSMIAFWLIEKKSSTPLIAVQHLRSRQVWPLIVTTFLTLCGPFAVIFFTIVMLSQDHEVGFGLSATMTGLLFLLPPAFIGVFSAPISGWLAGKWGWIRLLRIGLVATIAVLIVISLFTQSQWIVFASVAVLGITYNGLLLTTINGLGVLLSPNDAPSALPAFNGAAFSIGASVGITVVATFVSQGTISGYITGLWISIGFTILAFIISFFITPNQGQKI